MLRYRNDEDLDEYEDELEGQYENADEDQYEDADEDQYEDADQYEDEEDVEEEKEAPMSAEAIKYLEMREKMKAKHRSILRRENGKNGVYINHSKLSNYGSFFGPSKPVIADRVIQESKSLLETRHLAPKVSNNQNDVNKVSVPSTSTSKNGPSNKAPPAQVKSKAELIKHTRDYSFLFDAEIPKPKNPEPQKSLVAKPGLEDARSAQIRAKRYEPSSHSGKKGYNGCEKRKPSSGVSQVHDARSAPPPKSSSGNRASLPSDSRRQLDLRKQPQTNKQASSSDGYGFSPAVQKGLTSKKPFSSNERKMPVSHMERKPSANSAGNKAPVVSKTSTLDRQRLPMVKPQASGVNNSLDSRRDVQRSTDNKMLKKENVIASKFQTVKQPGSLQSNSENGYHNKKQKPPGPLRNSSAAFNKDQKIKKRKSPEPESDFDYRSAIRKMFGRPLQYHDDDDDDKDMEADFNTILREERQSAKIARKEDEEELIKIQEEERQEMLRKKARMRKMNRQ